MLEYRLVSGSTENADLTKGLQASVNMNAKEGFVIEKVVPQGDATRVLIVMSREDPEEIRKSLGIFLDELNEPWTPKLKEDEGIVSGG